MAQVLKPPARTRSPSSEQFKKATEHNPMVQAPARRRSASFEKPDLPPRTPSKAELRELAASGASNVVLWLQGQNEDEIGEELATLAAAVFA